MEEKFVQSRIDCLGKVKENIVFKTIIQSCKASQKCDALLVDGPFVDTIFVL